MLHPDEACDRIERAVPEALANRGDDRTLRCSAPDFPTAYQVTELLATLGAL
ncbi:hypothetical protein ATK30_1990 [Amycolatopsis echigonensis]|uniref:Uncharacterized protein n=1 Tax=Amycolatopsis echigonensis TaxID=2576905 RepID=A0A2N3WBG5_9PSEU|nr:hypothetical protein [Amycolatopsis niigatensis]PKV91224.1 hypothetical protein ATK30_1990 [Amycolatopsis niigatensis]